MYALPSTNLLAALRASGAIGATGSVRLDLLGTTLFVNDKSATGNLLQEWLGAWMKQHDIYHRENTNTQEFPDFYLGTGNETSLLEVKTFDYTKSPNFDVAQFDAYVRSLRTKAYRLDADYLIFGYSLSNGVITIQDIWLKKIWEITCGSKEYAVRTNVKQGKIHNIRPYNFKTMSRGAQPFGTRGAFVTAIHDTLAKYTDSATYADEWLTEVRQNYVDFTKTLI